MITASPNPVPTELPSVLVTSHGLTDRGQVRTSNEDHFLIAELSRTLWVHQTSLPQPHTHHGRNRGHVFLVADGIGGNRAGEVASALTVAGIEAFVLNILRRFSNLQATDEQTVLKDFQEALHAADTRLFAEAAQHPELAGMGTTLTLAFASQWKLFVVHAGDSRCYLLRGGALRQLTVDHTFVAELIRHGILKAEQAERHPYRHVLMNALGGTETGTHADVQRVDLEPGDVLLLCTDGLTGMLPDEQLAEILQAEATPQSACERLVAAANAQGGKDNITAVVARFAAA
jgi:protein phosphatase